MKILSKRLDIEFDDDQRALLIKHPNPEKARWPLLEIRKETLDSMTFQQASQFIGERLIMLIPQLREMYADYLWTEDGQPPKKQ